MGSGIAVRKSVIAEIVARARGSANEVCGLLLGDAGHVRGVVHCANAAADPATRFEIDPAQVIAAHRAGRTGGSPIVGCYHSHPGGAAAPSPRDAADAEPNGWLWLIVAGEQVTLHRAVADGSRHARFEPVGMTPV